MLTDLPEPVATHAINRHWLTRIDTGLYWGRPVIDHPGMTGVDAWSPGDTEDLEPHPDSTPGREHGTEAEALDGRLPELGHGVADSVEQVLTAYPGLADDPRRFAVSFQRFHRDEEPPEDHPHRWSWRAWGPYIGEQFPQRAFLADEPAIEEVVTFEVYEVTAAG